MSIVRSHLFPHIAFVIILALIAFFGFSRLRTRLGKTRTARRRSFRLWTSIQHSNRLVDRLESAKDLIKPSLIRVEIAKLLTTCREVSAGLADAELDFSQVSGYEEDLRRIQSLDGQVKEVLEEFQKDTTGLADRSELRELLILLQKAVDSMNQNATSQFEALSQSLYESENEHGRDAMITFVLLLALSLGYLYVVNWLLAKPIRNLAETARAVGREGKLSQRADDDFDGPVSQLSKDFNNMVDILVNSLAEEARVVRQLKVRTRELQQANEHKSRFLANVSHELKTPLNAVIGFADIMLAGQHGELSERQEDYLNRIFKAGTHLLSMISDLIDLAKLDLGALSLTNEACDIPAVCKEAADMLQPQLDAKGHKLRLKCPTDSDPIQMDPRRLKQILINLLGNAIKFTQDEGTITLDVSLDGRLVIKVIDTGIGISKADQKRIFQDFVQLDSALHRHHEGTGIGLTLTRRLVELMEGEITLESAPKKGSTFTVAVPIKVEKETKSEADSKSSATKDEDGPSESEDNEGAKPETNVTSTEEEPSSVAKEKSSDPDPAEDKESTTESEKSVQDSE